MSKDIISENTLSSPDGLLSRQAEILLRSITFNKECVLWVDEDADRCLNLSNRLACGDFSVYPVKPDVALPLISLDKNKKIGCVIFSADAKSEEVLSVLHESAYPKNDISVPFVVYLLQDEPDHVALYLEAGADRVLTPSSTVKTNRLIIAALLRDCRQTNELKEELGWRTSAIGQIEQGVFKLNTRREAKNLATMLSMTCPSPIPVAIGLTELMLNAIEHGCYGLESGQKELLLSEGRFEEEIVSRCAVAQRDEKKIVVTFKSEPGFRMFTICDPGKGFDFQSLLSREIEMSTAKSGRGVYMAAASFSELTYKGQGNIVEAIIRFDPPKKLLP